MPKKKITIYLTDEEYKIISDFSKKINSTFTGAGVLAIKLGIASIDLVKIENYIDCQEMEFKNEIN